MKTLAIATAALLGVHAPAALADLVILPNLYAREYCNLRDLGVSEDDAMRAAMSEATVDGTPVKITINGKQYDYDVVKASQAVQERCPQHL